MADDIIPLRRSYVLSMVERISELETENERLHVAIYWLVADIDHAHLPDPMGRLCITCGAGDGSWPCIHRKALDELKKARRG